MSLFLRELNGITRFFTNLNIVEEKSVKGERGNWERELPKFYTYSFAVVCVMCLIKIGEELIAMGQLKRQRSEETSSDGKWK